MGNRTNLSETVSGSTASTSYEVDPANRLTYKYSGTRPSSPNVVSDPNGNVLSDGTRTNVWDSENRLRQSGVGTKTSTFTYGADGLRRTMTVSDSATPANNLSKTFLLDSGMQVAERQNTGATATTPTISDPLSVTYLQGARGPECMRDEGSGIARWYLTDGLGSVLGEVLPSGAVDGKRKLDVYGVDRGKTGTLGSSQGFVGNLGHQTDEGTGLVYMRARYYDPNTGRFVSQDTAKDGQNWFTYCNANPVNLIDPQGKSPEGDFYLLRGELYILFGMVLLGMNFDGWFATNVYIASRVSDFGKVVKLLGMKEFEEAGRQTWRAMFKFREASITSKMATAMLGYLLVIMGEEDFVSAAFIDGR